MLRVCEVLGTPEDNLSCPVCWGLTGHLPKYLSGSLGPSMRSVPLILCHYTRDTVFFFFWLSTHFAPSQKEMPPNWFKVSDTCIPCLCLATHTPCLTCFERQQPREKPWWQKLTISLCLKERIKKKNGIGNCRM